MMQIFKPLQIGLLTTILSIALLALSAELIQYEEIAKIVVIPSLVLLIMITVYTMSKMYLR